MILEHQDIIDSLKGDGLSPNHIKSIKYQKEEGNEWYWNEVTQQFKIQIPEGHDGPIQQLMLLILISEGEDYLEKIQKLESELQEIKTKMRYNQTEPIKEQEQISKLKNQVQIMSSGLDTYFESQEFHPHFVCHQCHLDIVQREHMQPMLSQFSASSKLSQFMKALSFEINDDENSPPKSKIECLDLAFLFSDPLVKQENTSGNLIPIKNRLDVGTEFREILKHIQRHGKNKFVMLKEVATQETLQTILLKRPKIIHITCHGGSDGSQYYLALERRDTGILEKVTEEQFKILFKNQNNHKVELVFVSACHSEKIGNIFLQSHVPVVIAVNSLSTILESVCQVFAKQLYLHLLEGDTPQQAFEKSKDLVSSTADEEMSVCCCAHSHKEDCIWKKYSIRYGINKAHELHYISSCSCKIQWNKHRARCKKAQNYIQELIRFSEELDESYSDSVLKLQNYEDSETGCKIMLNLCCCSHELKHDESIKFQIKGDLKFLQTPLFNQQEPGRVIVQSDINQNNRLPSNIDSLELVGRNNELQILVQKFSSERESKLIHIFGEEGIGKTSIAKYAAKYSMDRRQFLDGIFYIDASNKYSTHGLFQKFCAKMQIFVEKKAQFVHLIKHKNILILIDNTKNLLEQDKDKFNKLIQYLLEYCDYLKLLVITKYEEDINKSLQKFSMEISCLSKEDAIELLIQHGKNSTYLKNMGSKQLQDHPIFNLIAPLKPTIIIQLAAYLNHKSLDEIQEEKEKMNQQELKNQNNLISQRDNEYREFFWILNLQFKKLQQVYNNELNILYFLCQTPFGLTNKDMERISQQNPQLYGNWEPFLNSICKVESIGQEDIKNDQRLQRYMIVSSNYIEDLKEQHYVVQPMVTEFINTIILTSQEQKNLVFNETLLYMSVLSRQLLKSIMAKEKKILDIEVLSNEIDKGMWSRNSTSNLELFPKLKEIYNPRIKFNYNESNFYKFIDTKKLQEIFQEKNQNLKEIEKNLDEIICNTISIFILLNKQKEYKEFIQKVLQVTKQIQQLRFLESKVELIKNSIQIKLGYQEIPLFLKNIEKAYETFQDMQHCEAQGEAKYLLGLFYIKQYHRVNLEEESQPYMISKNNILKHKNQIKQNIEDELKIAKKKFKQANLDFNLAKLQIIQAEFEIFILEKDSFQTSSYQQIKDKLTSAMKFFETIMPIPNLNARCLRNLALLYKWNNEIYEAKTAMKQAIKIFKSINNTSSQTSAQQELKVILDLMMKNTKNLFIFAKSYPLIEFDKKKNQLQEIENGTITRHPYEFKQKIKEELIKQKKIVKVKFEVLQLSQLNQIKKYGCRVLQLTSDVYQKDYLCIEGEYGQIKKVHIDLLKNILRTKQEKLPIDLVILAIPNSVSIGQVFIDLGIPYVIPFDINDTILGTFMNQIYIYPKILEIIKLFCIELCKNLIEGKTIQDSFTIAEEIFEQQLSSWINQYENKQQPLEIGKGPILLSQNKVNIYKDRLFGNKQFLHEGDLIDTSSVSPPSNIQKTYKPFTGRFKQTFWAIYSLAKPQIKIVNIIGSNGIGKTRFVSEIAYWENSRQRFKDGIFLLEVKDLFNLEQLKEKFSNINLREESLDQNSSLKNKNLLLILDDVDQLVKHSKNQFQWWLETILNLSSKLKIIITSKKKVDLVGLRHIKTRIILLPPLNNNEALDMLLTNCKKQIQPNELYLNQDERQMILKQLQHENTLEKCKGKPKFILELANQLESKDFHTQPPNILKRLEEDKEVESEQSSNDENQSYNDYFNQELPPSLEVSQNIVDNKPNLEKNYENITTNITILANQKRTTQTMTRNEFENPSLQKSLIQKNEQQASEMQEEILQQNYKLSKSQSNKNSETFTDKNEIFKIESYQDLESEKKKL